jgi:8-oxo-dGTP pyrophosphatase MutT (NUDIX family)
MLDFDAGRDGSPPRDAATLLLLRDGDDGVEVFCVERNKKSRLLGGAIVFPGGKVDPDDHDSRWEEHTTTPRRPSSAGFGEGAKLRAYAVAALRESLEEAALLPVNGGALNDSELISLRNEISISKGTETLYTFLAARGLRLDAAALFPFARWVTPVAEKRRYDTRFFLARAPEGQSGAHDERETMASFWARPRDILSRFAAEQLQLAPPTHRALEVLCAYATTDAALEAALHACLEPICPRLLPHVDRAGSTIALVLPCDPEHDVRELRVPGRTRFVLRGDRFVPEDAPALAGVSSR